MDTNNKIIAAVSALLFAIVLLIVTCAPAFGQVQVRHYESEVYQPNPANPTLMKTHILVASDGGMGMVTEAGDSTGPKVAYAFSGMRDHTDVAEDGTTAFCFTIDEAASDGPWSSPETEAFVQERLGGQVCVVWLETDEVFVTGGPFGEARSPVLNWCGEEHLMEIPRVKERSYGT